GANHLMTRVTECAGLLAEAGIEAGQRLMGPLLSASLDNALRYGDRALTGPTARGDSATVRAHLVEIGSTAPDSLPVYRALARRTADRAHGAGLLPAQAHRELLAVLEEER
ncbi:MAG: DUF2520 domain-containing protein, partial [Sciscionella sp.]